MKPGIPIVIGERFRLLSYGRGLAYAIERIEGEEWRSVFFVQGDDAAQFREELEAVESRHPDQPNDVALRLLAGDYYDLDLDTAPAA